jgi:FMN reductase
VSARLTAVLGSATPPGRLRRALEEAIARAQDAQLVQACLIDLAQVDVAAADGRPPAALGDDTAAVLEALASADVVLLATPVYRGSITGVLKNLLDHTPVEALERKPVAIVAMGASQHHYLGAERHLRDVLAFFGALVCPVAVYLSSADFTDGAPGESAAAQLDALLGELAALSRAATPGPHALRPLAARRR